MVDAESCANHRLPVLVRRPREGNARIDVAVVGLSEAGSNAAESLRSAGREVKWIRPSQHLVKDVEEAVANAEIYGEIWIPFEFVLNVPEVLRLAQPVDRQCAIQTR